MQVNLNNIYTSVNADKCVIGSRGYFADDIETLFEKVKNEGELQTLKCLHAAKAAARFQTSSSHNYILFYCVTEPSTRPYNNGAELLKDFEKRQHSLYLFANDTNNTLMITRIDHSCVYLNGTVYSFGELYENFHFKNGDYAGAVV